MLCLVSSTQSTSPCSTPYNTRTCQSLHPPNHTGSTTPHQGFRGWDHACHQYLPCWICRGLRGWDHAWPSTTSLLGFQMICGLSTWRTRLAQLWIAANKPDSRVLNRGWPWMVLNGKTLASLGHALLLCYHNCTWEERGESIAAGGTHHHLIAKVVGMTEEMGTLLAPVQLGFGARSDSKAAVLGATQFMKNLGSNRVLKLDFQNAFDALRLDKMLEAAWSISSSFSLLSIQHNRTIHTILGRQDHPIGRGCAARWPIRSTPFRPHNLPAMQLTAVWVVHVLSERWHSWRQ